jgi:hypothetical protein
LAGFQGESFWQCHLELDPLNFGDHLVLEVEP